MRLLHLLLPLSSPLLALAQLDARIKFHGKEYWGATANSSTNKTILQSDFGSITITNGFSWSTVEPSKNVFNFALADSLVNLAVSNGKLVRGKLLGYIDLPTWVSSISDKATLTSVIQNHVAVIVSRYKGKVTTWDVANEFLNADGTFRTSVFSNVLGTDWIVIALKAAHAVDPNAKLYVTDYGLDSVNAKTSAMANFVTTLKAAGYPIDGIGAEAHFGAGATSGFQAALVKLATANVSLALTEFDVQGASPTDYTAAYKACLNVAACVSITSAGICDVASTNTFLWNASCTKKPAYTAIIAV